jgi:hypothetical protein
VPDSTGHHSGALLPAVDSTKHTTNVRAGARRNALRNSLLDKNAARLLTGRWEHPDIAADVGLAGLLLFRTLLMLAVVLLAWRRIH